jgi:hypothetical protein
MAYYAKYLYHILVFKGPVQSSFFAPFGWTATSTDCLLW